MDELDHLKQRVRAFAATRNWEPFHTPKNLAMALVAEAAEVVEHFQWLTATESQTIDTGKRAEVALELADGCGPTQDQHQRKTLSTLNSE